MATINIEDLRSKATQSGGEKFGEFPFDKNGIISGQVSSPETLYPKIILGLLYVVATVAVLSLLYGGFLYITAGGEAEKAEKGKKVIVGSVIGIVLIASAFVIYNSLIKGIETGTV